MFLTPEEVERLTGSPRKAKQITWLRQNGYLFTVNLRGLPVVARAEAERHLVSGTAASAPSRLQWAKVA